MATGAGVRSLVETGFSVGSTQQGTRLRCRSAARQAAEVWLRLQAMNGAALDAPCPTTHRADSVEAAHADRPIVLPRPPVRPPARPCPRPAAPARALNTHLSPEVRPRGGLMQRRQRLGRGRDRRARWQVLAPCHSGHG
jgi:hypothetical protein